VPEKYFTPGAGCLERSVRSDRSIFSGAPRSFWKATFQGPGSGSVLRRNVWRKASIGPARGRPRTSEPSGPSSREFATGHLFGPIFQLVDFSADRVPSSGWRPVIRKPSSPENGFAPDPRRRRNPCRLWRGAGSACRGRRAERNLVSSDGKISGSGLFQITRAFAELPIHDGPKITRARDRGQGHGWHLRFPSGRPSPRGR